MRRFPTLTGVFLPLVAIALALMSSPARAADQLRASWRCLPPETCLVVRVPNGQAFLDAMRAQTKFGSVVLSQERLDKLTNAVTQDNKEEWEKFKEQLAKRDLKVEDWKAMAAGEMGFAITMVKRDKRDPLPIVLLWAEPSGDLGERILKAVQKDHDENKDKPEAATRVDSKVEGVDVMRFTRKVAGMDRAWDMSDMPPNFNDLTPEEKQEWFRKKREEMKNAKPVTVDEEHMMVGRVGGRVIMAVTMPSSQKDVRKAMATPETKFDLDQLTGLENLTATYARFIRAHSDKDDNGGAASAMLATPGLADALPAGVPLVEVLADIRPLLKLFNEDQTKSGARALKALAIDSIGPMGARIALDKSVLRSGVFVSAPTPRAGLLTILDQPTLKPEIPEWVPASAMSYSHLSLDLGKAFARVKELLIGEFGKDAEDTFTNLEQQAQGDLGIELPVLLSSLGQQHSMIEFEPKVKQRAKPEKKKADDADDEDMDEAPEGPQTSAAFVWQVKDEEPVKKFSEFLSSNLAMVGKVTPADEQGFTGFRLKSPSFDGGLFVGRKFMTFTMGEGVAETTLLNLRAPPKGKDAFKEGEAAKRAQSLVSLQPGFFFGSADASRAAKNIRDAFVQGFERSVEQALAGRGRRFRGGRADNGEDMAEKARAMAAKIKEMMPTDAELEGVLGASVGQAYVTGKGIAGQSAIEMPPAAK